MFHLVETFKTSQFFKYSIARFTIRLYVIFEVNKSSNLDSFVFAIFASMHDLILEFIALKKLARKFQTTYRWKNRIVEKITSLKKFQNSSLKSLKYKADDTNDYCKKMLKYSFRKYVVQMLQSKFNWYNLTKKKLVRFCWN